MAIEQSLPPEREASINSDRARSHEEKAKILLALLGRSRSDMLRDKGLDLPPPETLDTHLGDEDLVKMRRQAADLLRMAARAKTPKKKQALRAETEVPVPPAPKPRSPKASFADGADLSSRLLKYLDDRSLQEEHPAVIAHLLKSQSPQARAKLLRMLPGRQARAAMRILRQSKTGRD